MFIVNESLLVAATPQACDVQSLNSELELVSGTAGKLFPPIFLGFALAFWVTAPDLTNECFDTASWNGNCREEWREGWCRHFFFFFWQMWMHFVACVHQTVMSRYVLMLQNIIGIKGGNWTKDNKGWGGGVWCPAFRAITHLTSLPSPWKNKTVSWHLSGGSWGEGRQGERKIRKPDVKH